MPNKKSAVKKQNVTLNDLARMVGRGFEEVGQRFDIVDKRFDKVEGRLYSLEVRADHMDMRLGRLESNVEEIKEYMVNRNEFEDALARIKYIEIKLNIESGVK